MTTVMVLRWRANGLALIAAPRNDPMLKAARKVVIRAAQTRMELPKKGARSHELKAHTQDAK
jgi:hypothetical protein